MNDLPCPFRSDPHRTPDGEMATCELLQQLTKSKEFGTCLVPRSACEMCWSSSPLTALLQIPVFPSLLFGCCEDLLQTGEGSTRKGQLRELRDLAESALGDTSQNDTRSTTFTCDVFICCSDSTESTRRSIESLLSQREAVAVVHLIDDGGGAAELAESFENQWNVLVHRNPEPKGLFASLQDLVSECRTEFIALQHPAAASRPDRIRTSVGALERQGGELFGSAVRISDRESAPRQPERQYDRFVSWPTLVFRRSTFLDMGGFVDGRLDRDAEFVFRADCEDRKVVLSPMVTVDFPTAWEAIPLEEAPGYEFESGSLRQHAKGFPAESIACDVVIPFRGQLEYLPAAIESVLSQEDAETVIHLVDDASEEDTHELLTYWDSHPQLRVYRNRYNIGQYASFNNVSRYFETEFAAVQDSDDISFPNRLTVSGNLLRLSDADFFGGAMEQFGNMERIESTSRGQGVRRSIYPSTQRVGYFLMNPTACFRTSVFQALGGYADYGGPRFNRAGLDSEFLVRAYYAGVRFAISKEVVTRHRIHEQSATQNAVTGFGTEIRERAFLECNRRRNAFMQGMYDPRAFGGIGRFSEVTYRLGEG